MKLRTAAVAIAAFVLWHAPAKAADLAMPSVSVPEEIAKGPTKADVWTGVYVEGGLGVTSSNVEAGGLLTLGDNAWSGHLGLGADWMFSKHLVAGLWGRVHMDDVSFSIANTKLADTKLHYSVGGRLGFVPRDDWMVYALLGYRFASLDTVGAPDIDTNAWLVGGGIEAMLTDHWFIGLEAQAALGQSDTLGGVKIEATDYSGTARLGFKF